MASILAKLDQMDPEERKKIYKILKEEKEDPSKMNWMYKQDEPDTEEYLLGRRIDKHIEEKDKPEENKDAPGALFQDVLIRRAELDMQAKMREDPLYAIRQKEEEARKRLLQNPIKLKQLQKLMKECEKKKRKKEKKKKKKSKKKHKKSSDSDDSDDEILNQYLALLRQDKGDMDPGSHQQSDTRRESRRKSGEKQESPRKHKEDHVRISQRHTEIESNRNTKHRHDGSDEERKKDIHYGLEIRGETKGKTERTRSQEQRTENRHASKHHKSRSRSPHRSRSPIKATTTKKTSKAEDKHDHRRKHSSSPSKKESRKKLSAEEMERRRAEMLENARWRDEQRERNVKRYREEELKEKESLKKEGFSSGFLKPLLLDHVSNTSVEDRIKRNIYKVQRTKVDLEKSFTKR